MNDPETKRALIRFKRARQALRDLGADFECLRPHVNTAEGQEAFAAVLTSIQTSLVRAAREYAEASEAARAADADFWLG